MNRKDEIWRIVAGSQLAHYAGINKEWVDDLVNELVALEQEEKPTKQFPISECCNAGARLEGSVSEGTAHYVCTNCNNSCCIAEWSKPQPAKLPTVAEDFEDFWKDIVCNKDGSINIAQVKNELRDYHYIMQQVSEVYCHITGGKLSKLMYPAKTVIAEADDIISRDYVMKDDLRTLLE